VVQHVGVAVQVRVAVPVQAVYLKDVQHNVPMTNPKVRETMEQGIEWLATHLTKR